MILVLSVVPQGINTIAIPSLENSLENAANGFIVASFASHQPASNDSRLYVWHGGKRLLLLRDDANCSFSATNE